MKFETPCPTVSGKELSHANQRQRILRAVVACGCHKTGGRGDEPTLPLRSTAETLAAAVGLSFFGTALPKN
jgi:hypothetical protein